jgi:hypothetical protein
MTDVPSLMPFTVSATDIKSIALQHIFGSAAASKGVN